MATSLARVLITASSSASFHCATTAEPANVAGGHDTTIEARRTAMRQMARIEIEDREPTMISPSPRRSADHPNTSATMLAYQSSDSW